MGDSTSLGVDSRSAELLGADPLTRRTPHEIGPAETHETGSLDHQDDIAESRKVGASSNAGSHDGRDLRDAELTAHSRAVVENPSSAERAWECLILQRQEDPGGVDQVHDRNPATHRDLLDAHDLRHRLRKPAPSLDRGVVGHHGHRPPRDAADCRHHTRRRRNPAVGLRCDQQPDLQRRVPVVQ